MKKIAAIFIAIFLISSSTVFAEICTGDFDCDGDCDGTDASTFKTDFGRSQFQNPCEPCRYIDVPKTGQTKCYDTGGTMNEIDCEGTGQDGELQEGFEWPLPRFTDNDNGTVIDNLTGLMWTKDANTTNGEVESFQEALDYVLMMNELFAFGYNDWRVPNGREMFSLVDMEAGRNGLPLDHPFVNLQNVNYYYAYWTSTTYMGNKTHTWCVSFYYGHFKFCNKGGAGDVTFLWPVRGGH
jgi:hypothetical protein